MKGNPQIITALNQRLADEHTAIVQYVTHAGMCENWGYRKLAEYINGRAQGEMRHVGKLLDRILFLDGTPNLPVINAVDIGGDVATMFLNDRVAEMTAVAGYTESIDLALSLKDYGTADLLKSILMEEDSHLNDIEANMTQIQNVGVENYLPTQV